MPGFNFNHQLSIGINHLEINDSVLIYNPNYTYGETNYSYFQPKIVSNPKLFYPTQWDVNSNAYLPNYYSIVPQNAVIFNQTLVNNSYSIGFDKGSYYTFSTGFDPLGINFMGPTISYAEVNQTDGNGTTKHFFNRYKGYFELNSFNSDYGIPPLPKSQSLLAS